MSLTSLRNAVSESWPPFPVGQLPRAVQDLFEDFCRAAPQLHPELSDAQLTVVVPCFNPDPRQFSQLLLSLQLQSDQAFDLLLVNDGSSSEVWALIADQLAACPWVKVLTQPANAGISAALNAALAHLSTPYVALLDQDDLLHPAAIAQVRLYLQSHPDCGLLYTDHIVFDDAGTNCQYIPKSPWNPDALLEFNLLIHLTVVRADLYRACGGLNSRFDGIQDWEFYLRLAPLLSADTVGYLPLPLYAWRLSEHSQASSAQPKANLLALAQEFLADAHQRWGGAGRPLQLTDGAAEHYRFLVDRASPPGLPAQGCNLLLLAEGASPEEMLSSLESLVSAGFPVDRLFIAPDEPMDLPLDALQPLPAPEFLTCELQHLADHLPRDRPLLVLQAGTCLEPGIAIADLAGWLVRGQRWDLLTIPSFSQADGTCVSAGYARVIAQQAVYLPVGQGLSRQAYEADFASFAHTRQVDLPSPALQLLTPRCLADTLEAMARGGSQWADLSLTQGWWRHLSLQPWRSCCLSGVALHLPLRLVREEQQRLAKAGSCGVALVSAGVCFAAEAQPWPPSYSALLRLQLEYGSGRLHPLHAQAWLASQIHPALLQAAAQRSSRLSLLPREVLKPVVILIPTELNPRSHGHACMLTMAFELQKSGQPVALLPFNPYTFFRRFLWKLPPVYLQLRFIADLREVPNAILIVPESAPPALVKKLRKYCDALLWWLLAPAGLLTHFKPSIRSGDRLVAFSEFTLPGQSRYLFVNPQADPLMQRLASTYRPKAPRQLQIALYSGKGRLRPLPLSLHRHLLAYRVVLITRTFPATKASLLRLLGCCHGLISFDPLTNLSLEAASLGVPTFVPLNPFSAGSYGRFPVDLRSHITDSPGAFIQMLLRPGPVDQLATDALRQANADAVDLVAMFSAIPDPIATEAFHVTEPLLRQIEDYRRRLKRSFSIQTVRDGESISSMFAAIYVKTLKSPYFVHYWFCQVLYWLDRIGDVIFAIGLFPLLRPIIRRLGAAAQKLARLLRRLFGHLVAG